MTPPSPAPLAGRYRIGESLGTGGMATVYDAFDERLQRPVAVKVLRPEMAARPDVRARFESEARAAAQLSHPNVVAVFDSGEDGDTPFLVMERLPGETLAGRLQAGPVETEWVLRVAGDVLGALGAAHAAGIVHRDVKPGNILITGDGCAKVGDFGIAKSLEVAAGADLTSTNQLVGTPAYVAPERVIGQPATSRSDLYAVGVVLYEAFSGRKPFAGRTPVATAYAIRHETPPALASLRPDLPAPVVAAVERAMDRDPSARFASAAEFAAALGVRTAGGPVAAPPPAADDTIPAGAGSTQVLPAARAAVPLAALVPGAGDRTGEWRPAAPFLAGRRRLLLASLGGLIVALVLVALATASTPAARRGDRAPAPGAPTAATSPPTTAGEDQEGNGKGKADAKPKDAEKKEGGKDDDEKDDDEKDDD